MEILNTRNKLKELTNKNTMTIIYFSGSTCGACDVIRVRLEEILTRFPKIITGEINGEENIEIAAEYDVFSLPITLLYIEGKETLRIGRNVDFTDLEKQIKRYYDMIFN